MSQLFDHRAVSRLAASLFEAAGAPPLEASLVAEHLVTSSLMGLDSHGVLRVPEYLDLVLQGKIVPGAPIEVRRTTATTAIVDCGYNFGAVGAVRAIEEACHLARHSGTASVITRHCNHVGRLGAYVQAAAEQELVAIATCNSPVYGHFVLPWGGREGRLATNPVAYAVPTGGDPIVADISTSVAPEGKIRKHMHLGQPLPEGWVVDAGGRPTTDAAAFYGPPRGGILPLGGSAGHKGYALGLLVEVLGSALAGVAADDPAVVGNGVCLIVLDPKSFCPIDEFKRLMDGLVAYIKSSPPAAGFDEVLVPGEPEFRTLRRRSIEGIPIDPVTINAIRDHASRLACSDPIDGVFPITET